MDYALPIGITVFAWWLSTVVVMYRAGLHERSFTTTLIGATVALVLGLVAFAVSLHDASPSAAYLAFFSGLLIWVWHEVSYLFGFVTGPQPEACPPGVSDWRRFILGVRTCIYHELAIVTTAGLLAAASWGAPNKVALWTFCILWLMRWSVKLNIFLGVRNLHMDYLPEHLRYLGSFVRHRSMNELFPLSMLFAVACFLLLIAAAVGADPRSTTQIGATLLATLLGLAIIEHSLLVVNFDDSFLWRLGLKSRGKRGATAG